MNRIGLSEMQCRCDDFCFGSHCTSNKMLERPRKHLNVMPRACEIAFRWFLFFFLLLSIDGKYVYVIYLRIVGYSMKCILNFDRTEVRDAKPTRWNRPFDHPHSAYLFCIVYLYKEDSCPLLNYLIDWRGPNHNLLLPSFLILVSGGFQTFPELDIYAIVCETEIR